MKKAVMLLFIISVFSCSQDDAFPKFTLEQPDVLSDDEYNVYNVILANYSNSQLIVRQQTTTHTPLEESFETFFSLEKMSNMEASLYSNYENENISSIRLDERIEVSSKESKLISNEEYTYYFERVDLSKGWQLFQKKYPSSNAWYFYMNQIGFNENRTQALVGIESYWYMESPDGPTLHSGMLHYLEKEDGVWQSVGSSVYAF